jgi:hypothetical protein
MRALTAMVLAIGTWSCGGDKDTGPAHGSPNRPYYDAAHDKALSDEDAVKTVAQLAFADVRVTREGDGTFTIDGNYDILKIGVEASRTLADERAQNMSMAIGRVCPVIEYVLAPRRIGKIVIHVRFDSQDVLRLALDGKPYFGKSEHDMAYSHMCPTEGGLRDDERGHLAPWVLEADHFNELKLVPEDAKKPNQRD